ncbi:hypothetical protein C0993_004251 [Termitomyces sp. T159_Od127]|nr:hypothetical protein C0993_004251 [Termitomyces sp. T159_Od127]
MRGIQRSRLPLPRLSRCLSSAAAEALPEPQPKPDAPSPPSATSDPSDVLARTLRNSGSIDTTLADTLRAQRKAPSNRPAASVRTKSSGLFTVELPKVGVEPSNLLARTLRNDGSIDGTLLRTLQTQGLDRQREPAVPENAERLGEILRKTLKSTKPPSTSETQLESSQSNKDDAKPLADQSVPSVAAKPASAAPTKSSQKKKKKKKAKKAKQAREVDSAYRPLNSVPKSTVVTTGWGQDQLQPTNKTIGTTETLTDDTTALENASSKTSDTPKDTPTSKAKTRLDRSGLAPHLQPSPSLSYIRRIEGLLEPSDSPTLESVEPPSEQYPIARLSHGLERVLFNPGIHWLQDPRSKVYNFPPYLEMIPKVTDFAFERLGSFIKSSRDNDLWDLARREKRTFAGSTSSLSGMLSHIYFLLSGDKEVNTDNLSRHFGKEPRDFTSGQRMPASVILNHNDGVYAIDSDSEKDRFADKNILTWMGTLLEKFLTSSPEEFAPYMRFNPPPPQVEKRLRDAYRFAKASSISIRLPGTGVFDIKTRACLPIRMDLLNFEENSGYLLRSQTGKMESFEREYYDLIRSAFLKYSFQVRIGNMDGVIVAYHNTARIFGFQYISLQEMDEAIFGSGPGVGDRVFEKCVGLLEKVLEEAAACFPGESVKCTFEKLNTDSVMNVWVQQEKADVAEGEAAPIKQLEVKVSNFLGQMPVRGSTAVAAADEPWTTHWSISRLMSSKADIHLALDAAKSRQFRYIDIPTGLDMKTVGAMWSALNFGGVERAEGGTEPPPIHYFKEAGPRTQELRDLARAGRAHTEKKMVEEAGQAKVWVNGTVEWTELQKVLELFRAKEAE